MFRRLGTVEYESRTNISQRQTQDLDDLLQQIVTWLICPMWARFICGLHAGTHGISVYAGTHGDEIQQVLEYESILLQQKE